MRTIVEESPKNIAIMDVFSKLVQDRIIFIDGDITPDLANGVIAQMLYLKSKDPKKPIDIYINSNGGSVYDGLAIYDVGMLLPNPIITTCIGMAASMGAILMLMGNERNGLKHSRTMIHQPMGGAFGQASDMKITMAEMEKLEQELYDIIEERTNIKNAREICNRDKWYTAKEALEVGILTEIK